MSPRPNPLPALPHQPGVPCPLSIAHRRPGDDDDDLSAPSRVRFAEPSPSPEAPPPRKSVKRTSQELEEGKEDNDLASTLRATRESDRKKGKAVAQQIVSSFRHPRRQLMLSSR